MMTAFCILMVVMILFSLLLNLAEITSKRETVGTMMPLRVLLIVLHIGFATTFGVLAYGI